MIPYAPIESPVLEPEHPDYSTSSAIWALAMRRDRNEHDATYTLLNRMTVTQLGQVSASLHFLAEAAQTVLKNRLQQG